MSRDRRQDRIQLRAGGGERVDLIPDPAAQTGKAESVRLPTSDLVIQDKEINKRMADGWEHYETTMVYGNEMILRFRK